MAVLLQIASTTAISITTEEREFFIALGGSQQTIQAYESGKRCIKVAALPELARLLSTRLEELFGQQQENTVRERGPAPKWQQQLEAIYQLPKSQQKFVAQMLDALIAQATTKSSS